MFKKVPLLVFIFLICRSAFAETGSQNKKSYLEDIFIWKISDELKLSVQEEKSFTEISKQLNRKKAELNKKIQESIAGLNSKSTEKELREYRKLLHEYNQLSLQEFDKMKKALSADKFIQYLRIKNELTNKMKSLLASERDGKAEGVSADSSRKLSKPKVIIER